MQRIMPYATIQPPFTLKLREMPKKELRRYYQWFMDVLPERINELAAAVRETPGFESWQPDFTPASLDALGQWFACQVETRSRTQGSPIRANRAWLDLGRCLRTRRVSDMSSPTAWLIKPTPANGCEKFTITGQSWFERNLETVPTAQKERNFEIRTRRCCEGNPQHRW
jgi:hypothetical protein